MVLHMAYLMYQVLSQEKQFNRHFIINCNKETNKVNRRDSTPEFLNIGNISILDFLFSLVKLPPFKTWIES